MANELQITLRAGWTAGGISGSLPDDFAEALGRDVAGHKNIRLVQDITTLKTKLNTGDVGEGGYMFLRNVSAVGTIKISGSVSPSCVPLVRLGPGDVACFRLDAAEPYAQADIDSELEFWLIEE